jgi:hypothetical protein
LRIDVGFPGGRNGGNQIGQDQNDDAGEENNGGDKERKESWRPGIYGHLENLRVDKILAKTGRSESGRGEGWAVKVKDPKLME